MMINNLHIFGIKMKMIIKIVMKILIKNLQNYRQFHKAKYLIIIILIIPWKKEKVILFGKKSVIYKAVLSIKKIL